MDFAKILFSFYSLDDLRSDLFKPEERRDAARVFRDAVAVLLSLAGYSPVVLKEREKKNLEIVQSESGFEVAHADIIAFKGDCQLLLIDCTASGVDDSKVRRLQDTVNHFSSKEFSSEEERKHHNIMGVIFSPRNCESQRCHYHDNISIVDSSRIERILDLILEGKIEQAARDISVPH